MDALAHNDVHHPVVWKSLFLRAVDDGLFSRKDDTILNAGYVFQFWWRHYFVPTVSTVLPPLLLLQPWRISQLNVPRMRFSITC